MKKHFLATFVISFLLWLLLTSSFATDELVSGVVISLVVSMLASSHMEILGGMRIHIGFIWGLLSYLGYFFFALIKANLDLAKRVLSPNMHIHPRIVEIKTTMQSDLGKLFLANSITLTPGTLTVDVFDDRMLVHWIDCPENADMEMITSDIVGNFEKYLKRFVK